VDDSGSVKVTRVFAATDAYHVVNPNLVEAQIEGGVIFGLTAMLFGEINIKSGAPQESNFDSYRMLRLADSPDVNAALALTGGWTNRGKPKWAGWGNVRWRPSPRRWPTPFSTPRASASARCRSRM